MSARWTWLRAPRQRSPFLRSANLRLVAPFPLTHLLLPTLRGSAPSRIVNVASIRHVPIDFDDVMLTREYDGKQAYGQSKLALAMLTLDLAVVLQSRVSQPTRFTPQP